MPAAMDDEAVIHRPWHRRHRWSLATAAVVVVAAGLWLHARSQRLEVEDRAAAVASVLAGRDVRITCPGPIKRRVLAEVLDGSVQFGADGRPSDTARLTARPCDGLRVALDGGADLALECLPFVCTDADEAVARALAVLAHEAAHLGGILDEAQAECTAMRNVAWVARQFGLPADAGRRIAAWQRLVHQQELPERYRQTCA